ncbi:MAG TPA: hypothetical protein VGL72_32135 [Bryobacteraceae bacterium]|jgi:hypothetical protein
MLNIFNQISNLASGTLAIVSAVAATAPQVSGETQKQAVLDLAGIALEEAAKVAAVGCGNAWVALGATLLPAVYDEVMTVVNKHGLIANTMTPAPAGSSAPAKL